MIRRRVVLPTPLEPMSPVNSPLSDLERDAVEDRSARRRRYADVVDLENRGVGHRCSVEVPWTTAALMAVTSASIQDW